MLHSSNAFNIEPPVVPHSWTFVKLTAVCIAQICRVALFSNCFIPKGTELCYDYGENLVTGPTSFFNAIF